MGDFIIIILHKSKINNFKIWYFSPSTFKMKVNFKRPYLHLTYWAFTSCKIPSVENVLQSGNIITL